MVGKV